MILSKQQLITLALDEEEKKAKTSGLVYQNVVKLRIMAFKKMSHHAWLNELESLGWMKVPQGKVKANLPEKKKEGEEEEKKKEEEEDEQSKLSPRQELVILSRLRADPDKLALAKHGYILKVPTPAEVAEAKAGVEAAHGWESCDRCQSRFQVFPGRREDGELASGGECRHHWGKPYRPSHESKSDGRRYGCCHEDVGATLGCTKTARHVFKASDRKRMASVLQFVETPANADLPADRAVCVDCEMCYTVHGMELVRVTATSWPGGDEILDVLVRPMGEILDLNTNFSGITPRQLADARPYEELTMPTSTSPTGTNPTNEKDEEDGPSVHLRIVSSPAAARDLLFKHIGPQTPLIGHALENDLAAMRIIHPYLVDSVLVFLHQHGLPYRYRLQMLVRKYLDKDIQMGGKVGHDSKEDARAAGDLIRYAVAREWRQLRGQGWSFDPDNDVLLCPSPPQL